MSDHRNPGPPLIADEEFCIHQPPTAKESLKASLAALMVVIIGGGLWLGLALLLQRISALAVIPISLGAGWAVNRAARRRRSVTLGIMAAASSALATLLGFGLLWLPLFNRVAFPRQLSWYDVMMMTVGAVVAYGMAGQRNRNHHLQ